MPAVAPRRVRPNTCCHRLRNRLCQKAIKYPIVLMFSLELLINLTMQFLFALKFYNIHNNQYIKAYQTCFCVYSGFYYIGLLPYIMIGIGEENHLLVFKKSDGRKGRCLSTIQAILFLPLFLLRAIKLLKFRSDHPYFNKVIDIHYIPAVTQAAIMIPYLIIEGIFYGCSNKIQDPWL